MKDNMAIKKIEMRFMIIASKYTADSLLNEFKSLLTETSSRKPIK
jgi:hypothetical protein